MKTVGLTRRIDELGRIVIPKEIRQNMKLKPGELLEVYISDSDILSMRKHEVLNKADDIIKIIVMSLSKTLNSNVYITKNNMVVFSNDKDIINKELSIVGKSIYNICPNGDDICKLVIDDKVDNENVINFVVLLLESYYELN